MGLPERDSPQLTSTIRTADIRPIPRIAAMMSGALNSLSAHPRDLSDSTGRSISIFSAGNQLLKGAALHAVQIAEELLA